MIPRTQVLNSLRTALFPPDGSGGLQRAAWMDGGNTDGLEITQDAGTKGVYFYLTGSTFSSDSRNEDNTERNRITEICTIEHDITITLVGGTEDETEQALTLLWADIGSFTGGIATNNVIYRVVGCDASQRPEAQEQRRRLAVNVTAVQIVSLGGR